MTEVADMPDSTLDVELAHVERAFQLAGGRGVDLADYLDELRAEKERRENREPTDVEIYGAGAR